MNAFAVSSALLHGLAATRRIEAPKPLPRVTPPDLRARARDLTAAGFPVILDDADMWIHAVGFDSWIAQLSARIHHAEMAQRSAARVATLPCITCRGSGREWEDEGEQDWRRIECPDCLGSGRRR